MGLLPVTRSGPSLQVGGGKAVFSGLNAYWLGLDDNAGTSTGSLPSHATITAAFDGMKTMGANLVRAHTVGISAGTSLSYLTGYTTPPDQSGFVTRSGTGLVCGGVAYKPFFGSINGQASPASSVVTYAQSLHLNSVRLTDWIDTSGVIGTADRDSTRWGKVDAIIAAMATAGMKVVLDLSCYRNMLRQQLGVVQAYTYDWTGFLSFVLNRVNTVSGKTYKSDPAISYVSFAGEVDAPAYNGGANETTAQLTTFYTTVTNYWRNQGGQQLLSPGGWLYWDDPNSGIDRAAIAALANVDILGIHAYSASDLSTGVPAIAARASAAGKPWINEEFGQDITVTSQSDSTRATYFQARYNADDAQSPRAAGEGYWNITMPGSSAGGFDVATGSTTAATIIARAPTLASGGYLPQYNEANMDSADWAVYQAGLHGIYLICPLTDNWNYYHSGLWWFVHQAYLQNSSGITDVNGATKDDTNNRQFFANTTAGLRIRALFKAYVTQWLNHVNPYTGLAYKNDPTIAFVETGNEIYYAAQIGSNEWTQDIASTVKSTAPGKLVADGSAASGQATSTMPGLTAASVDVVGGHYYPQDPTNGYVPQTFSTSGSTSSFGGNSARQQLTADLASAVSANRAFFLGEYPWTRSDVASLWSDIEASTSIDGDLAWSFIGGTETHGGAFGSDDYPVHYPYLSGNEATYAPALATHIAKQASITTTSRMSGGVLGPPLTPTMGTAAGGFNVAGSATGSDVHSGTATGAPLWTGTASGGTARAGQTSGGFTFTGNASGTAPVAINPDVMSGGVLQSATVTATMSGSTLSAVPPPPPPVVVTASMSGALLAIPIAPGTPVGRYRYRTATATWQRYVRHRYNLATHTWLTREYGPAPTTTTDTYSDTYADTY